MIPHIDPSEGHKWSHLKRRSFTYPVNNSKNTVSTSLNFVKIDRTGKDSFA